MLPVREVRLNEAIEVALDRFPRLGVLRGAARQLCKDLTRFRPREDGPRLERLEIAREALHRGVPHLAERVGRKVAERLVHRSEVYGIGASLGASRSSRERAERPSGLGLRLAGLARPHVAGDL